MNEDTPSIGGYEWALTCECCQTLDLAGLSDNPVLENYSERPFKDRIRRVQGMRTIDCPRCENTLRFGIETVD